MFQCSTFWFGIKSMTFSHGDPAIDKNIIGIVDDAVHDGF